MRVRLRLQLQEEALEEEALRLPHVRWAGATTRVILTDIDP
jgi:hypothetical protein